MNHWEQMENELDLQKEEMNRGAIISCILGCILISVALLLAYVLFWNVLGILALRY